MSVTTLIVCNVVILGVVVWLFYQILSLISNRSTAITGCITLLLLFAFPQFIGFGNYNFVCPYSHECTHGIVLSLLGIWCLRVYQRLSLNEAAMAASSAPRHWLS